MSIADLRRNYTLAGLRRSALDPDPAVQFRKWLDEAVAAGISDPNAMTLATASREGLPTARVVLLKGLDHRGFGFFTNYESAKARDLEENPNAALVFFWADLERQVRVSGTVSKLPRSDAEEYFKMRPRGSRIGAWISKQSSPVASREVLENAMAEAETRYGNAEIPLPPFWGGYALKPYSIEFWQGRPNRVHDRFRYQMQADGTWKIERLSP